jgi:hypothetical protein
MEDEKADKILDRLSGLWGAQTPLGLYLEENGITTLFFGGVNADQCVVSSLFLIPIPIVSLMLILISPIVGHASRCVLQGQPHPQYMPLVTESLTTLGL